MLKFCFSAFLLGLFIPQVIADNHSPAELQQSNRALLFKPSSLTFTVAQNGSASSQSSTISSNRGNVNIVRMTKSGNSNWLVLPSSYYGYVYTNRALNFSIKASGLSPGTYKASVTASANGYSAATLQITLVVTSPSALSFSPSSLSFSVTQNGTTANKSSVLNANTGNPKIALTKSANNNWLVLPAAATGTLSFGINAAGLTPGTYTDKVIASANSYTSATLQVSLTVTAAGVLSFSPASLSFSAAQNGTTASKASTLTASNGSPGITISKSANSNWLLMPTPQLGSLSFGINTAGLTPGSYSATVTASSNGYTSATCNISLQITPALSNLKVNFQDSATVPPTGWIKDFGQAFGSRTTENQGTGNNYGWLKRADNTLLDLTKNGRKRNTPSDILLATLMHMQGNDIPSFNGTAIEGKWEAQVTNGKYDVTVSVGDDTQTDSKHSINVEGVSAISLFAPASALKFKSATVLVTVSDGRLTIDAIGGTNTKINWIIIEPAKPAIVSVNPPDKSENVSDHSSISTNILRLPYGGIDNTTITSSSVFLTENSTGVLVPSNVNGTGGGDAITLVPSTALKLNTVYKFNVTSGVKDLSGNSFVPYTSTFTTASSSKPEIIAAQFERVELPTAVGRHSNVTIGPDGKLYALTIDGIIKRFTINSNGTLSNPQLIYSLQDAYGTRTARLAIGLAFDPSSTANNLIAWITHSTYVFVSGPDWDGKLTRLTGNNLQTVTDVLVNLPRSAKDHLSNSIVFGPDGALYFTQGSNSAMGKADQTWSNRAEHLLSCAVLRLDLSKLGALPLNVKTSEGGGTYNPYSAGSALTIYASGVRNAYDLAWHTNGSLYVATNGSAAGGSTPASVNGTLRPDGSAYNGPVIPALSNVQQTQNDYLFRIIQGGYYGHPNPIRGEYVLNGGNPSASTDPGEVSAYPVGTLPDANWRGYAFDFKNNISPNGTIEYKSNTFNGALKGKLLVVRYSQHDDIITLTPGASKDIVSAVGGESIAGFTGFIDPLDITEDVRNGNIYVSEYGGDNGKIVLLRPTTAQALAQAPPPQSRSANLSKYGSSTSVNTVPGCDEGNAQMVTPAENTLSGIEKARISPNPVFKRFNLYFPKRYEGDFTLQIVDPVGRTYQLGNINLKKGGSSIEMNISKLYLKSGVYFLKITSAATKSEIIKLSVE